MMDIKIIKDEKGFALLEPLWDELLNLSKPPNFTQSYTWLKEWWKNLNDTNNVRMHIMVFSKENKIVTIAPLVLIENTFWGFRYHTLCFMGTIGANVVVHRSLFDRLFSIDNNPGMCDWCDFIPNVGESFDEVMDAFWSYLVQWKGWDILDLREMDCNSRILTCLNKKDFFGTKFLVTERVMWSSYSVQIEGEFQEFFKTLSQKTRRAFNLARNRIHKCGRATYHIASTAEEVADFLPIVQDIERKSWKSKENKGWFCEDNSAELHKAHALKHASKGEFEIHYLKINDRPVCYICNWLFDGRRYLHNMAYDPDFKYLSPSFYLTFRIIEDAFQRGCKEVSFGRISSFYKRRFNPVGFPRVWWTLYSGRAVPRLSYWIEFKLKPSLKSCLTRERGDEKS